MKLATAPYKSRDLAEHSPRHAAPSEGLNYINYDDAIINLDLSTHKPIMDRMLIIGLRRSDKQRTHNQKLMEVKLDFAYNDTKARIAWKDDSLLKPADIKAIRHFIIDIATSLSKDPRFGDILAAQPVIASITIKVTATKEKHREFHQHEDDFCTGIIGLQRSSEYQGGELIIAKGDKEAYDPTLPIKIGNSGRVRYLRTNSLWLDSFERNAERIYHSQKPEQHSGVFWPEAKAKAVIPAANFMEHAVKESHGDRVVGIFSIGPA